MPFRVSHEIAGEVVALAEKKKIAIDQLEAEDFAGLNPVFGDGSGTPSQKSDRSCLFFDALPKINDFFQSIIV